VVRIGADSPQLGADLQRLYTASLPDIDFTIVSNTGSISAVTAIGRGDADLGYARADVAYFAFHGMLDETSESFDRLRAVSQIGEVLLHVVRRPGAPIRSLHDLNGRPVAIGPPGSGVALLSRLVLAASGIEQDATILRSLPHEAALAALLDGRVDVMFLSSGYPNDLVERAARAGARLLPVGGSVGDRLVYEYPFVRRALIPAHSYPSQTDAVRSLQVQTLLVCSSELDDHLVYELTKHFFSALPALARTYSVFRTLDLTHASATPIPLHEGASHYYREQELFR
jgi:TRAP transporter TAXI family solute receptor